MFLCFIAFWKNLVATRMKYISDNFKTVWSRGHGSVLPPPLAKFVNT